MALQSTGDLFRPTDPAFLADPYPTYARLRREAPIARFEGWKAWIVTRHRDVDRLLRDRRLGRVMDEVPAPSAFPAFAAIQAGSLLEIEGAAHDRVRQVVHEAFTPRHVRALEARVVTLVDSLVDGLEARPERAADLLTDFAEPLPVTVIADLLGVPQADRGGLLPWSKAIIGMFEPERTPDMERAAERASAEFAAAIRRRIDAVRLVPADDLITRMVRAHDEDSARLREGEIVANAILFLNAGHEAVVNVIGNGMLALLRHPEQLDAVRGDPGLVAGAVEEMMRFDTPLQFFERLVLEDMTYEGHEWSRGTKLCLFYASANHDPEVFDEPTRFDVRRSKNPHLAFGLGVHYCIGAPLARIEVAAAVRALLERLPDLRLLTSEPAYEPRNVFRYLRELRVAY
ncbi:MAG: cytochrome P450 [Trueperaceae bacterium]|nr:cytochrome P450 [Trueperaceae bacterium]